MFPVFDRILIAKLDWGDFYQGEELVHIFDDPNDVGGAYERFNFRRTTADGRFYGNIPREAPTREGNWLVVFISRDPGGSLRPVGWYEDASFEREPRERPEYAYDSEMPLSRYGKFTYRVSTDKAYVIPPALRTHFEVPLVANEKIQMATFVYARDQTERDAESWRQELARFAERVASGQVSS